jgi:hypothetical protein
LEEREGRFVPNLFERALRSHLGVMGKKQKSGKDGVLGAGREMGLPHGTQGWMVDC